MPNILKITPRLLLVIAFVYLIPMPSYGQDDQGERIEYFNDRQVYEYAPDYVIESVYNENNGLINMDNLALRQEIENRQKAGFDDNTIDAVRPKGPRSGNEGREDASEDTSNIPNEIVMDYDNDEISEGVPQEILDFLANTENEVYRYKIEQSKNGWILAWVERVSEEEMSVKLQLFDATGKQQNEQKIIDAISAQTPDIVRVHVFENGNFVLFWSDYQWDGLWYNMSEAGFKCRVFDAGGITISGKDNADDYKVYLNKRASFHVFENGNIGVFYYGEDARAGKQRIKSYVVKSDGSIGQKKIFHCDTNKDAYLENVSLLSDGRTMIVWQEYNEAGNECWCQFYGEDGTLDGKSRSLYKNTFENVKIDRYYSGVNYLELDNGQIAFITEKIIDKKNREYWMHVRDRNGDIIGSPRSVFISMDSEWSSLEYINASKDGDIFLIWNKRNAYLDKVIFSKIDIAGNVKFEKDISTKPEEFLSRSSLFGATVLENGNMLIYWQKYNSATLVGNKWFDEGTRYYFDFYAPSGARLARHEYTWSFGYTVLSEGRVANIHSSYVAGKRGLTIFDCDGRVVGGGYDVLSLPSGGGSYSHGKIYEIGKRFLTVIGTLRGLDREGKLIMTTIDLFKDDSDSGKVKNYIVDTAKGCYVRLDKVTILDDGSLDIITSTTEASGNYAVKRSIVRHRISLSYDEVHYDEVHIDTTRTKPFVFEYNRFIRETHLPFFYNPYWLLWRHIGASRSHGKSIDVNEGESAKNTGLYYDNDTYSPGDTSRKLLFMDKKSARINAGTMLIDNHGLNTNGGMYYSPDSFRQISGEKVLSLMIESLKNKEEKTDIQDTLISISEAILEESSYMKDSNLKDFEETISLVMMFEAMKEIGHTMNLKAIRDTLTSLLSAHMSLYDSYLNETSEIYDSIADILTIEVSVTSIKDAIRPLHKANKILSQRKRMVDEKLDMLQGMKENMLTQKEKKALEMARDELMPVRKAYISSLESLITGYMLQLRKILSKNDPFALSDSKDNVNAVMYLDRGLLNKE